MLKDRDDLALFLNLHPSDLLDDELLTSHTLLSDNANRIFLEITERAAIHNVAQVRDRVAQLRRVGYRIAVDDLGAGYAGLASFAALEPELVKLDMALTQGSDKSPVKRKLIRAMCDVCKDLGVLIVAEGIETEAEMESVTLLGCDFAQGFFLGRPEPGFSEVHAC
jgi:EAL domain-containing protein (putative c-di-GMP-specific phosphodiesterase class I)